MAITYALRDNIAEITLDDGKVNAMTLAFFQDLGPCSTGPKERPGAVVINDAPHGLARLN